MQMEEEEDIIHGYIYVLICPMTGIIKYVGRTKHAGRRAKQHRRACPSNERHNPKLYKWIKGLNDVGMEPIFKVLIICKTFEDYVFYEPYLIKTFDINNNLLNNQSLGTKTKPPTFTRSGGILKHK